MLFGVMRMNDKGTKGERTNWRPKAEFRKMPSVKDLREKCMPVTVTDSVWSIQPHILRVCLCV